MSPQELVKGVVRLVSLPEVCTRVNEMVDDPHATFSDIGAVISQDTALTARLLRIVNSAFYGITVRIETVSRAITIIGARELRDLMIATSAVKLFDKIPNDLIDMTTFWRHSVYCGVVARLLASRCDVLHSERLFVAGLLHDVGSLIIYHKIPDLAREALLAADRNSGVLYQAEQEVMGFDHAQVGGELMREWRMPATLQEAVEFHHDPGKAGEAPLECAIVYIANIMTKLAEQNDEIQEYLPSVDLQAWKITRLSENVIEPMLHEASAQFAEALNLILPQRETYIEPARGIQGQRRFDKTPRVRD